MTRPRWPAMALGVAAAVATLVGCGDPAGRPPEDASGSPATGRLVIVGGGLEAENGPVWEAVLAGRDGAGRLCVIPTASGDPEPSMRSAVEALDRYGGAGAAMGVLIAEGDTALTRDPEIAATLLTCSGFWFTGGSQSRITETFLPGGSATPAYQAVRDRFREGAVVAGTSAGAAVMSPLMIAGGSSEGALTTGLRAEADGEGVWVRQGLGFFDVGVVDQHFLARGRIGRLLVAVLEHPEISVGFGIDENTAMVVDGDLAEIVGTSGVVVVDGRGGASEDAGRDLFVSLAGSGDRVDLQSLEIELGADKRPIVAGDAPLPDEAILERWIFLQALYAFSRRLDFGMVVEPVEGVVMTLEKGDGFFAGTDAGVRATEDGGAELEEGAGGVPAGFSVGPFRVALQGASR